MKNDIQQHLVRILESMGVEDVLPAVEVPEDAVHGDYTTNVAMLLSKQLKKAPVQIANDLKDAILKDQTMSDAGIIDRVEVAGPGFINIYVPEAKLINQISRVLKMENAYGFEPKAGEIENRKSKIEGLGSEKSGVKSDTNTPEELAEATVSVKGKKSAKDSRKNAADENLDRQNKKNETTHSSNIIPEDGKKRITMEFTDPNPFKEFHIGHLYSNTVGESLSRLLAAVGNTVRRVNYQGDVGMHVAKSLWGLRTLMKKDGWQLTNVEALDLPQRIKYLGKSYACGASAYEEDEKAKVEMQNINYLVFIAAQEFHQQTTGRKPQVNYRQYVTVDEQELADIRFLYEKGRAWSLDYFETIYKRLGTTFGGYYFESIVGEVGLNLVRGHIADGIFEESDGAVIYRGEKVGLHTRVFINKLGLPTYEAKELGLAPTKYTDSPYDLSIIVTANEINEYFKVLIAAMTEVEPELGTKTRHIGHGMVRLPEGKMSSRTGKVLLGEWLLDETKKKIYALLKKNSSNYTKEQQDVIAEKGAVAAVKYSLLRVSLPSNISFDIDASVSFDGDSGPYLQYTYARCKSVLRKIQDTINDVGDYKNINLEESAVARKIMQFPDVVSEAAERLSPNILCTYLFSLAQVYNFFYAKHSILSGVIPGQVVNIDASKAFFRLALTKATAQVIKNGLYLLGIDILEQM